MSAVLFIARFISSRKTWL